MPLRMVASSSLGDSFAGAARASGATDVVAARVRARRQRRAACFMDFLRNSGGRVKADTPGGGIVVSAAPALTIRRRATFRHLHRPTLKRCEVSREELARPPVSKSVSSDVHGNGT